MTSPISAELDKHYDRRVELRLQIDKLEAAIQRVRELHREVPGRSHKETTCEECYGDYTYYEYTYPCPTIKALDGDSHE